MNRFDIKYMALVEEKLQAVTNKTATVTTVAKELSITRQTIYTWKARYQRFGIDGLIKPRKKRTDTPHNKTSDEIEQLVINTAGEYWCNGVEALADHIQRLYNLTINSTTVYRILKRRGVRYGPQHPRTTKRWKIRPTAIKHREKSFRWISSTHLATNKAKLSTPSSMMQHVGYMPTAMPLPTKKTL